MPAEKIFENKVKRYLESIGCYNFGTPNHLLKNPIGYYEKRWGGGQFSKTGLPDMHVVLHGVSIEIELKAPNGKPSAMQLKNLSMIKDCGCHGFILVENPATVNKIKTYIKNNYPQYQNVDVIDFDNFKVFLTNILTL